MPAQFVGVEKKKLARDVLSAIHPNNVPRHPLGMGMTEGDDGLPDVLRNRHAATRVQAQCCFRHLLVAGDLG